MNDTIAFTPGEIIQLILTIAGFIVAIDAAIVVVISWWHRAHRPEEVQDARLDALEEAVRILKDEEVPKMKRAYYDKSAELTAYEDDNKKFQKVMVKSLQALTEHAINNDNEEQLKQAMQSLNDYLVDK
jgi:hypothetical protein